MCGEGEGEGEGKREVVFIVPSVLSLSTQLPHNTICVMHAP